MKNIKLPILNPPKSDSPESSPSQPQKPQTRQTNPFSKSRPQQRQFLRCPRCEAKLRPSTSWEGRPSEFWKECPSCNTYVNTYIPQIHQAELHRDGHRYIGNFGAYGTGKTLTSRQEVYKHAFLTPNAAILIGANVTSQYEQTIKRDIELDLPKQFISYYSAQKSYIDLRNGARILYRPFDDPDKLRSLNLSMFVMIEGSEVKGDTFHQLKTRLRNTAATIPHPTETITTPEGVEIPRIQWDWRRGIVESNPDAGWIREDVLMASHQIHRHGGVTEKYTQDPEQIDDFTSSHVTATAANRFLPENFIEENIKNKPGWWINRYIHGSFSYAEGLVYPHAMDTVVSYFEPPRDWKRLVAYDYGLSDDSVFLFGAVDEDEGILYIYKERVTNNKNIEELAKIFHEETGEIPVGGWATQPIIDPKSGTKRDYNKKTLLDHFADFGINFKPGHIQLDARIYRTNTYIESGKLRIMDNCTVLMKQLKGYKFPPRSLTGDDKKDPKPIDKNNHAVDPLGWICMELPANPKDLTYGAFDVWGRNLNNPQHKKPQPWQLADKHPLQAEYYNDSAGAFGVDYY